MKKYKGVLPVFPEGWYVVCLSEQLQKGGVVSKVFCGQEVVLYRGNSGKASMLDAYCSHMGAHFGHGGKVEGELLRCPFHGFCFDTDGECVKTSYGTKPSPRTWVVSHHIKEMHGVILGYFHPEGKKPEWHIPDLNTDEWTPLVFKEWELDSHPQETAENSVDLGHFLEVHNYSDTSVIKPFNTEGPYMNARYGATRNAGMGKKANGKPISLEFEIYKWGFGYSAVEAHIKDLGMVTRQFVFPTPVDGDKISLRIAMSIKKIEDKKKINPMLALFPEELLRKLILKFSFKSYQSDVMQDFKIWNNKTYVHPPALAKGDGPVMQFRKWAEQFYHEPTTV